MDYKQLNLALSFLEGSNDRIVLQLPYVRDYELVKQHIFKVLGKPIEERRCNFLRYQGDRYIVFETISQNKPMGVGYGDVPVFLIDRKRDRSYYEKLEPWCNMEGRSNELRNRIENNNLGGR